MILFVKCLRYYSSKQSLEKTWSDIPRIFQNPSEISQVDSFLYSHCFFNYFRLADCHLQPTHMGRYASAASPL